MQGEVSLHVASKDCFSAPEHLDQINLSRHGMINHAAIFNLLQLPTLWRALIID